MDESGRNRAAIVGLSGASLTDEERAMLHDTPPLGVILFKRNIEHPAQLAALVAAIREIVPDTLLTVDQEGGRVARLRPPHWNAHPPAATFGALHLHDPSAAMRAAFLTGALIGAECAASGFDLVCAPVLDLAVPGADPVIGDRAFSPLPEVVAALGGAVAEGLLAAGVQPVGKHAPGHGRALVDSHLRLPELDVLDEADLLPFRLNAWMPWMMTAHIRFRRLDPLHPATLSPAILGGVLRDRLALRGVLVSDDLSMHAVAGEPGALAASCLAAGCDVALHCSGIVAESRAVLEQVGAPSQAARTRLDSAARLAADRVRRLDTDALRRERDALLRPDRDAGAS